MDINTLLENMKEELKTVKNKYVELFNAEWQKDLQQIKDCYPNLDVVYITGFTPAWNDGEECVHCTYVYVDNTGQYSDIHDYFESVEREDFDYSDVPEYIKNINKNLSKSDAKDIQKLFQNLEDTFEEFFGTNWKMTIDFTQDEVLITSDEYECGY